MPLSVKDGLNAVAYIREHASELGVDPNKMGFMGFFAGEAVTLGVAYTYDYFPPRFPGPCIPVDNGLSCTGGSGRCPPLLVICASDDPLQLAPGSLELYSSWLMAGKQAGLHMYARGGHGFGM